MNFKIIFILFSVFLVPILVFSQTSVDLNWENLNYDNFEVESFDNAIYLSEYSGLPSFQKMLKITNNYYYEIEVYDTYFADVNESEKNKLKHVELSEEIIYSSDVKLSSNTPYQRFVVFPYINVSGKYKKLTKFKYRYTAKKSLLLQRKYSQQINSVLKDGNWYKISVDEDGVYSLSYSDLQSLGVNVTNLDVNSIRLYGNGGGMLPRLNSEFRYDDIQENLDISDVFEKKDVFALTVNGDSMIDACIAHGDMVLMEPIKDSYSLKNGTIVSALVPGLGTTLKYFFKKGNKIFLEAANSSYEPIELNPEEVIFQGKLLAVWRKV